MVKLGPFFYIDNKLLFDAKPIEECEKRLDKYDNPCQHVDLKQQISQTKTGCPNNWASVPLL